MIWDYVIYRCAVKTVVDLGSELGYSANYFYGLGKQVIAVDGLNDNCESAINPTVQFDLARGAVH